MVRRSPKTEDLREHSSKNQLIDCNLENWKIVCFRLKSRSVLPFVSLVEHRRFKRSKTPSIRELIGLNNTLCAGTAPIGYRKRNC